MSFESFLQQRKSAPSGRRRVTYTLSVAFHAVLLMAGVFRSFWYVDELTPPVVKVTFLAATAPPPPPPPPARKKTTNKVKRTEPIVQPRPNQIIQPKVEEPPKEEEEDEGVEGGVEGGVPGGVLGGVAGEAPVTALLAPKVGSGQLISDVHHDPRYTPTLPAQLNRAGMVAWGLYRICVSIAGQVTEVRTLKPADPLVEHDWVAKIRTWQYRPYSINGRPVPYCYPMRLEVRSSG